MECKEGGWKRCKEEDWDKLTNKKEIDDDDDDVGKK